MDGVDLTDANCYASAFDGASLRGAQFENAVLTVRRGPPVRGPPAACCLLPAAAAPIVIQSACDTTCAPLRCSSTDPALASLPWQAASFGKSQISGKVCRPCWAASCRQPPALGVDRAMLRGSQR